MTTSVPVIVQLPHPVAPDQDAASVADALRQAADAAAAHGVEAVLIPHADDPALDPTVLAGLLSADRIGVPILVEAHTGRHAPFNLARRVQTLARLTAGGAGLYLRDTGVDPVTAASRPAAASAKSVVGEYARVLRLLWDSFPEAALLGDRDAGLFADVTRIAAPRHRGEVYGVEGALNIPIAPDRRPVLIADGESSTGADHPVDAVVTRTGSGPDGVPAYRALTWAPLSDGAPGRLVGDGAAHPGRVLLRIDAADGSFGSHLEDALGALDASGAASVVAEPSPWRRTTATAVA